MLSHEPIQSFLTTLTQDQNLPKTEQRLMSFLSFLRTQFASQNLSWKRVKPHHLKKWIEHLSTQGVKGNQKTQALNAVRFFYDYLSSQEWVTHNPALGLHLDAPRQSKKTETLTLEEVDYLLNQKADDPWEKQTQLLIAMSYQCALRLSRSLSLTLEQLENLNSDIFVAGQNKKQKQIHLTPDLKGLIEQWIDERRAYAKDPETALFINKHGDALRAEQAHVMIRQWGKKRGFPHLSQRILRTSKATHLFNETQSIEAVQKLLGSTQASIIKGAKHWEFDALSKAYLNAHPRKE